MPESKDLQKPEVVFLGFALGECVVQIHEQSVKYLRAIHRVALELAVQNRFGVEVGGFWLMSDQIQQLRALSEYYPQHEEPLVRQAIEAYLKAQLDGVCKTSCWRLFIQPNARPPIAG